MKNLSQAFIDGLPVSQLETEIRRHNQLYFVQHAPEITDESFDRLVRRLKELNPQSPVLEELGSDIHRGETLPKVFHSSPMLSLDKCYSLKELTDWAAKIQGDLIASPKIDGCAVSIRYDGRGMLRSAATRGDGTKGEDVLKNIRFVRNLPQKIEGGPWEVRGEVYMPLSVFETFRSKFANPRNLAAGAIKQKDPRKTGEYQLHFFAYELKLSDTDAQGLESDRLLNLRSAGFETVPFEVAPRSGPELQAIWEGYLQKKSAVDYEIDGVVYKANRVEEQTRLGASAHHPRWAIAYKFQGDLGVTTLRNVEWSVARTGVITPIGITDPVLLSGAKVSRVSLHNYGMLKKLNVTVPCKVVMVRRGGVIPHVEEVLERQGEAAPVPVECPSCGSPTKIEEDFLWCGNPKACREAALGELDHFLKVAEIDGFGSVLVKKLYQAGLVSEPADFYRLTEENLLPFERMGPVLAKKLVRNVRSKTTLPLAVFLQSLGISELARHVSQILAREFKTLDRILTLKEEELFAVHTIGPVTARSVVEGLQAKRALADRLLEFVKIEAEKLEKPSLPLSGKSFLFTGKLASMDRSDAEKKVEGLGGEVASGVSRSLDYLVVGSESYRLGEKGNKWMKAEKLAADGEKIQVLSEEEFLKMV